MTWTRAFPEILLVVMLIVVSSSPHGCLSAAVIPSETRLTAHSFLQPTADNISPNSVRTPRRMMESMSRLMEYFRNTNIFASIRAMLDNNNGVRKEWVPLGSLMFNRPLGQRTK